MDSFAGGVTNVRNVIREAKEIHKSNQKSKRNRGSAAKLKGICCLASIFCNDFESSWTEEAKKGVLESLSSAVNFIKESAKRYNINLEIIHGYDSFQAEVQYDGVIPVDMFADPLWTEDVLRLLGYTGGVSAVHQLMKKYKAKQVVILYHVNKKSISYNLSFYKGVALGWYAERGVLFFQYDTGGPTAVASYVHEILHAFGAGELYFPFDSTDVRRQFAGKYFPDDVMYRVDYDLTRLNIGRYTAYRIGWLNKLDRELEIFEDDG